MQNSSGMDDTSFNVSGNIVDILNRRINFGTVCVRDGHIFDLSNDGPQRSGYPFILPGFIDSHIHIESSMLVPSEFARIAVIHGTVATVSDPHEIANVCGCEGIDYMIKNGKQVPFKFHFGAPSCVPATSFETAGANIDSQQIKQLLNREDIGYLSEMMNFPGVLTGDPEVMHKIAAAKALGKPIDGHAPGLRGENAKKYINAGISTDHECYTRDEALEKLSYGMKILIREGSAAKNFDALVDLLREFPEHIMFCSDDKHPDSLVESHINSLCARAVAAGIDVFNVLMAACINPVRHYRLNVGTLKVGDPADFITVNDLRDFTVLGTYIDGTSVAENGRTLIKHQLVETINRFNRNSISATFLSLEYSGQSTIPVIEALDGQLITEVYPTTPKVVNGKIVSDPANDILKIVVLNRYEPTPPAVAFIKNFGLKHGALASTVAHDSHNIIAVGVHDEDIAEAINLVVREKGGISCVSKIGSAVLALPVAGLMSAEDGFEVAKQYMLLDQLAKESGSTLSAPFMTLSFMALLVIPSIKLSDRGLFNSDLFRFY